MSMNQVTINMQTICRVVVAAVLLALAVLPAAALDVSSSGPVIRMQLRHADAGRGLSPAELLHRMALRSQSRRHAARFLSGSSSSSSSSARVTPGHPATPGSEYLVHLGIGTPSPQPVQLTLDTGSDLVWTQCQPCSTACFKQALPYLDPSLSSTFQQLACRGSQTSCPYSITYGDNSVSSGQLVADTFVFDGGAAVPNLSFGCGLNNSGIFTSNETGIAGFGRGAMSLPSQLKVDNFSYCFTNLTGSTPSPVLLGLPANLYGGGGGAAVQTTPLIQSPNSSWYYLNLMSITVGSTTLEVPASAFALNAADGTGGTFIDSGTSFTLLPPPFFNLLSDAFASELDMTPVAVTSLPHFLCFPASSTPPPTLQFQFDGATLDLPQENYVFLVEDSNGQTTNMCIAILSSGDDGRNNVTTIGNFQQQNLHVLYDLVGNTLSFVPAQCDMV